MADSASTINESGCAVPTEGQPFDFEVRLGLSFIVQAACFSALAVTGLLLYIAVCVFGFYDRALVCAHIFDAMQFSAIRSKRGGYRGWTMSTHVHWYFLSLMVSELIQAIGECILLLLNSPRHAVTPRRHSEREMGQELGTHKIF